MASEAASERSRLRLNVRDVTTVGNALIEGFSAPDRTIRPCRGLDFAFRGQITHVLRVWAGPGIPFLPSRSIASSGHLPPEVPSPKRAPAQYALPVPLQVMLPRFWVASTKSEAALVRG
jgi:hypothetical protein